MDSILINRQSDRSRSPTFPTIMHSSSILKYVRQHSWRLNCRFAKHNPTFLDANYLNQLQYSIILNLLSNSDNCGWVIQIFWQWNNLDQKPRPIGRLAQWRQKSPNENGRDFVFWFHSKCISILFQLVCTWNCYLQLTRLTK